MERHTFEEAKTTVFAYYEDNNYSRTRIKVVRYALTTISRLVEKKGLELDHFFTDAVKVKQKWTKDRWISIKHVAGMIRLAMEGKPLGYKVFSTKPSKLWPAIKGHQIALSEYLEYQRKLGKTKPTINNERYSNAKLLCFLESEGLEDLHYITGGLLERYIQYLSIELKRSTMQACIRRNYQFLVYLSKEGLIEAKTVGTMNTTVSVPQHVVSVLNDDQVEILMEPSTPLTGHQARDNAVLLCGLELGLRRSDIYQMKLSSIDWHHERLNIIQRKTGVPLTLPLPKHVGKALATYIMKFRPKVESDYVFLSLIAPYRPIVGDCCSLVRVLSQCGLVPSIGGYHILRRTCASSLLSNGTKFEIVSGVLGQTSSKSLDPYICLDISIMRSSPLTIPVGISKIDEEMEMKVPRQGSLLKCIRAFYEVCSNKKQKNYTRMKILRSLEIHCQSNSTTRTLDKPLVERFLELWRESQQEATFTLRTLAYHIQKLGYKAYVIPLFAMRSCSSEPKQFKSTLGELIETFIRYKRSLGYKYCNEERFLAQFDKFLVEEDFKEPTLTREIVHRYCMRPDSESPKTRKNKIDIVRHFGKYLVSRGFEAYVYDEPLKNHQSIPYTFDSHEIRSFFHSLNSVNYRLHWGESPLNHVLQTSLPYRDEGI